LFAKCGHETTSMVPNVKKKCPKCGEIMKPSGKGWFENKKAE